MERTRMLAWIQLFKAIIWPGYIDFVASQEVKQHSEDSAKSFLR